MSMVRATWTSSNPAVATVSSSGVVTAVASGTTNIVATMDGLSGQATLTVLAPTGADPSPGPGAVILLDMRQPLQRATTIDQAFALFGAQDHTPFRDALGPTPNGSGWSFTTNADGHGLHALRADWSISHADQGLRVINYFPTPKPTEVYAQWKNRLGKYAADADANGANDSYAMFPQTQACKRALFDRPDDKNRVDFTLGRFVPEQTKVEMGDHNYSRFGDPAMWNPNQAVGGAPYTTTVHVRTASADGVPDGIFQLWIDGKLLIDRQDVPAESEVFDRWSFPETCVLVPQPQSEYFWDILVWRP
jgi:hypothetical protein